MADAINGVTCSSLARLNPDGSRDRAFTARFSNARFEEVKRRFELSRIDLAARPKPAAAPSAGSASTAVQSQGGPSAASQTVWVRQLEVVEGAAVIDYDGAPNGTYILQARDSVDAPVWSNIATNQANDAGRGRFRDASAATAPARFYRVLSLR